MKSTIRYDGLQGRQFDGVDCLPLSDEWLKCRICKLSYWALYNSFQALKELYDSNRQKSGF